MFAILHGNGTYYRGQAGIGPMFGGSLEQAEKFETKADAILATPGWQFVTTEVVEIQP